ncbi:SREC-like protein, partial [Mya arenaria]
MYCILNEFVCTGFNSCDAGEDETPPACDMDACHQNGRFFCKDTMQCIQQRDICDGVNNCVKGEDETASVCTLKRWCVSKWSLNEGCLGECKPGYFGKFCEKTCSKDCLNGACDSSSGICTYCTPGYFGKYCQSCSETCLNRLCNSSSGICKECTPGSFGKNCEKICSKECLNGICNRSTGICNDCTRTYLERCTLNCGQGCREREGFPQCDRQSGKCLNGCFSNHYGNYCNVSCMNCKGNSSVALCVNNGVCLYGCKNDYWDTKCNSKCSTNCEGDAYGNRCNSSTGECVNGCTRGGVVYSV